ncbi:transposase [Rhodococcus sp. ABRD24]|uniref:integrase core domain-containing protein n=1 Tax=Rhodococcus sp. ABRD24 TaxID=2507582 RepID=UPI001F616A6F|nr:transposase [Rhodococcus sp. ABRD24]
MPDSRAGRVGLSYIPPGTPWNNGYIESFNNRLRWECLNRNHWTNLLEARVVIGDFKGEYDTRHRHSGLEYLTPVECAARCSHQHHPVACEIIGVTTARIRQRLAGGTLWAFDSGQGRLLPPAQFTADGAVP